MSILKNLEENRVFSVKKLGGEYWFTEECDYCFGLILSKEEVKQLAHELLEMIGVDPAQ